MINLENQNVKYRDFQLPVFNYDSNNREEYSKKLHFLWELNWQFATIANVFDKPNNRLNLNSIYFRALYSPGLIPVFFLKIWLKYTIEI